MKALIAFGLLGLTSHAMASCELTIDSNDAMQYDRKEMTAGADCSEITVTLNHTGTLAANVMGHNWVLVRTDDMQAMLNDAWAAGLEQQYLPADDARVLAATDLIGGGGSTSVSFDRSLIKDGESYSFVCTFPGHFAVMQGRFTLN